MSKITVLPATYADIDYVANHLRALDREEFVASVGRSPENIMAAATVKGGDAWCGFLDDVPAAIYGLEVTDHFAIPWMVGTDAIAGLAVGRHLVRQGRKLFAQWAADHGTLSNYAYARNTLHLKFIRLLGCEIGDPQPYGATQLPFRKFTYVPSNARRSRPNGDVGC